MKNKDYYNYHIILHRDLIIATILYALYYENFDFIYSYDFYMV